MPNALLVLIAQSMVAITIERLLIWRLRQLNGRVRFPLETELV